MIKVSKRVYTRYGVYSHRDPYQVVYRECRTGGYDNSGYRLGDSLPDGRVLHGSKNRGSGWTTVYAVAQR